MADAEGANEGAHGTQQVEGEPAAGHAAASSAVADGGAAPHGSAEPGGEASSQAHAAKASATPEKIVILAKNVANAPILKTTQFSANASHPFSKVIQHIQNKIRMSAAHKDATVHLFINQSFSPSPDEQVPPQQGIVPGSILHTHLCLPVACDLCISPHLPSRPLCHRSLATSTNVSRPTASSS